MRPVFRPGDAGAAVRDSEIRRLEKMARAPITEVPQVALRDGDKWVPALMLGARTHEGNIQYLIAYPDGYAGVGVVHRGQDMMFQQPSWQGPRLVPASDVAVMPILNPELVALLGAQKAYEAHFLDSSEVKPAATQAMTKAAFAYSEMRRAGIPVGQPEATVAPQGRSSHSKNSAGLGR